MRNSLNFISQIINIAKIEQIFVKVQQIFITTKLYQYFNQICLKLLVTPDKAGENIRNPENIRKFSIITIAR